MQINMFWDGLFHAYTWMMTALGLRMLWRAVRRQNVRLSGRTLFGANVFGWGLFNLVEGIIEHHLLGIHHVVVRQGESYRTSCPSGSVFWLAAGFVMELEG